MRRGATQAAALAMLIPLLAGGVASGGSRYSFRGAGEVYLPQRAESRALGGAEAAAGVPDLSGNPANLALAMRTLFYGSYDIEWIRTEEPISAGGARVRKGYDGLVPNLVGVFPLPGRVVLGTGLLLGRRRGGTLEGEASIDGQSYRQVYEASGNLMRFPALLARRFGPVEVGGGLHVQLLNSKASWRNEFPDGSDYVDSEDLDTTRLWGVAWKLGVRVPLGSRFALGAWTSQPMELRGTRTLEYDDPTENEDDLELHYETDVAPSWCVGVVFKQSDRLRLLADWTFEPWEELTPLSVIDRYTDVNRFAVGLEWIYSRGEERRSWPVRVGFRTEPLHTLAGGGREVTERVFTAGSGIDFAAGQGELDWYFEYGWRGERDVSEFYEQFVRFGLTLSGHEVWTRRPPPEEEW